MRGVSIQYHGGYGAIFKELFKNISWENFSWHISEVEIIKNDKNMELPDHPSDTDFFNLLTYEDYLVVFTKMEGYRRGRKQTPIKTYEDFLHSDCEIMILITDSYYMDIYVKGDELLLKFLKNVERLDCERIELLTDQTDSRTEMRAW